MYVRFKQHTNKLCDVFALCDTIYNHEGQPTASSTNIMTCFRKNNNPPSLLESKP